MKYSILKISPLIFIKFCQYGSDNIRVVENKLPEDVKFIRAYTEDHSGWGHISLVLESESFRELKDGDEIPILPYPMFEKVR